MPTGSARTFYLAGLAVMILASFCQIWITIVGGVMGEDNPQNQGFLGVVVTAAACAFVANGKADGMARGMLATAAVQALLGTLDNRWVRAQLAALGGYDTTRTGEVVAELAG